MMKRAKVLELAAVDGTVRFLLLPLIERLASEGYEVHVACTPGKHLDLLEAQGWRVHRVRIVRTLLSFGHVASIVALIRLFQRERFDVVHVHTPVAAALGRMAARFARVPIVIYTAHGFYFHDLMPAWMRRTHIWIEKLLCRWCTHALFTQSAEDRDTAIQEKLLQRDRIFWIGNGVDVTAFSTSPRLDLRAELELLPADLVVGFIGRLVREKGVEELLEAMGEVITRVPTAKLLIVGDTLDSDRDRRTRKYMKGIIQRTNLEAAVKFAGFRVDIPQLLSTMDLLVLPSHREGMPRTILEAMASGKPVVATDIRGCREEVVDGGTGFLVPVKNPLALAEAIVRLLTNKEEASRMGEAGRRRAREKFDEKKVVERQLEIYRELLNQTKGTGGA